VAERELYGLHPAQQPASAEAGDEDEQPDQHDHERHDGDGGTQVASPYAGTDSRRRNDRTHAAVDAMMVVTSHSAVVASRATVMASGESAAIV
jgi:hypothetical protein